MISRAAPARIALGPSIRRLSPGFLSVSIDMSQLLGGLWWEGSARIKHGLGTESANPVDFTDERLVAWTRAFAGSMLRLGGTASDRVRYAVDGRRGDASPSEGRRGLVLSGDTWKGVSRFCTETGLSLMMTLNCGKSTWDAGGRWDSSNALELLRFDSALETPTAIWALGNEVNGYPFVHGIGHFMGARRYCRAFEEFAALVEETHPAALKSGPASSFWPVIGEPNAKIDPFLRCCGELCDVLTWHYYPVHSHRGSFSTRWASPGRLLEPKTLDELGRYSRRIGRIQERRGFAGERWLGELGPALYGGEPGLSDRFLSGLWWLDALSSAALTGEGRVARQTLFGSEYGLLQSDGYAPNPDYWNCLLWKELMGAEVCRVDAPEKPAELRVYAHAGTAERTLLAINTGQEEISLDLRGVLFGASSAAFYHVDAPDPYSRQLRVNGVEPSEVGTDLRELGTPLVRDRLTLAPLSYCFVVALTAPALPPG